MLQSKNKNNEHLADSFEFVDCHVKCQKLSIEQTTHSCQQHDVIFFSQKR